MAVTRTTACILTGIALVVVDDVVSVFFVFLFSRRPTL